LPDTSQALPTTAPETLLEARYREAADAPAAWNETLATLIGHRSVRAFRPDPLPDGALELALAAASSAPTSSNLQTWSVLAVQDPARKARLGALAANQKFIAQAPLLLLWLADLSRLDAIGQRAGTDVGGVHYLEALLVAVIDAALAAQNAVAAFESLGLGTVYIGAMRNKPEAVAAELGLPKLVFPAFGLSVGHPDPTVATGIKPRLPPSVVLHHERYTLAAPDRIAAYEGRMGAFQAEQGMAAEPWLARCIVRMRDARSLSGRDRMRDALAALGFELK
jgi:nitroreductase